MKKALLEEWYVIGEFEKPTLRLKKLEFSKYKKNQLENLEDQSENCKVEAIEFKIKTWKSWKNAIKDAQDWHQIY